MKMHKLLFLGFTFLWLQALSSQADSAQAGQCIVDIYKNYQNLGNEDLMITKLSACDLRAVNLIEFSIPSDGPEDPLNVIAFTTSYGYKRLLEMLLGSRTDGVYGSPKAYYIVFSTIAGYSAKLSDSHLEILETAIQKIGKIEAGMVQSALHNCNADFFRYIITKKYYLPSSSERARFRATVKKRLKTYKSFEEGSCLHQTSAMTECVDPKLCTDLIQILK